MRGQVINMYLCGIQLCCHCVHVQYSSDFQPGVLVPQWILLLFTPSVAVALFKTLAKYQIMYN